MIFRRQMSFRVQKGSHIRIVYCDEQLQVLKRARIKIEELHVSEYLSKQRFFEVVTSFLGLEDLSVPPWVYERLSGCWWWHHLAGWLKSFVKEKTYTRKFWTERNVAYVKGLFYAGRSFAEISAMIYQLFRYKITVRRLICMAIERRWIPAPRPKPPWERRKNY